VQFEKIVETNVRGVVTKKPFSHYQHSRGRFSRSKSFRVGSRTRQNTVVMCFSAYVCMLRVHVACVCCVCVDLSPFGFVCGEFVPMDCMFIICIR